MNEMVVAMVMSTDIVVVVLNRSLKTDLASSIGGRRGEEGETGQAASIGGGRQV